jgi:hypothetical protein
MRWRCRYSQRLLCLRRPGQNHSEAFDEGKEEERKERVREGRRVISRKAATERKR